VGLKGKGKNKQKSSDDDYRLSQIESHVKNLGPLILKVTVSNCMLEPYLMNKKEHDFAHDLRTDSLLQLPTGTEGRCC
jgi:hypothetical protein